MWVRRGGLAPPEQPLTALQRTTVHPSEFCAWAYDAAATHPYPTGAAASLLASSLLRPISARVAWGRQAPGRATSASGECSGLQEECYNE